MGPDDGNEVPREGDVDGSEVGPRLGFIDGELFKLIIVSKTKGIMIRANLRNLDRCNHSEIR